MENSIDKKEITKLIKDLEDWYQSFCDKTGNVGAMLFNDAKHDNKILLFKSDNDTARKIYEYTKAIT